ncbi:MAG: Gfo/Idh/MocA family oxidoreductase [bacterium]
MAKLNFGIIGCGRITDLHAPGYARSDRAQIYAVCDINRETAERRMREWGAEKFYTDYREMLADPAIHAVEIITPHHLHKDLCVEACRAGKHVSVQKPMALSASECDAMILAAEEAKVQLKVFENFVFYPPYVKAKELIDSGAIGEPLSMRIRLGGGGKGGWKVPFKTWLWRLNEQTCGGGPNIFDDGYHKFSIAIHFLGEVESVHAWVDRSFGIIDAPAMISWEYKTGKAGVLDSTMSTNMTIKSKYYSVDERVEVIGTEGVIWVTRCTAKLLDEPAIILYNGGETRLFENIRNDWLDSFIDSTQHFIGCLLDGGDPMLTGRRGKEVLQFALAAIKSSCSGLVIRPDDITE